VAPVTAKAGAVVAVAAATLLVACVGLAVVGGVPAAVLGGAVVGTVVTGAAVVVVAAVTTIVPCMKLCTRQWYVKVPAVLNVNENVPPLAGMHPLDTVTLQLLGLLSNAPVSDVTLCPSGSWLVQVTVVPAGTVSDGGA